MSSSSTFPSSTMLLMAFLFLHLCLSLTDAAPRDVRGPRRFQTPSFLRRERSSSFSSQSTTHSQTEDAHVSPSSIRTIQSCDNEEPSDCEARFAMQYGHELRSIRACEHAYLMHDEEFACVPASNQRIVPSTVHQRPLESDLIIA
mmetsp:Transcript_1298/g.2023  ORF Transcript_1298/g.2023 Transcript_1298/m.2023 type:complete len:145 (-) Transcript_1298:242-676(-)